MPESLHFFFFRLKVAAPHPIRYFLLSYLYISFIGIKYAIISANSCSRCVHSHINTRRHPFTLSEWQWAPVSQPPPSIHSPHRQPLKPPQPTVHG